jgi:regulator of protease activity HflC (stomatin/prohibitin superfamily)
LVTDYEYKVAGGKSRTTLDAETEQKVRGEHRRDRWKARFAFLRRRFARVLIVFLLAVLILVFRHRIFITVLSGEVAVIDYPLFGGTSHNQICTAGLQVVAPWDTVYRYNIRTQSLLVPMSVLTRTGVSVRLDAQIRFHIVPESAPYLHREYGPNYVEDIVKPELTQAVQDVIGSFTPQELYSSARDASSARVLLRGKRIIGGVYVTVDDLSLYNFALPEKVDTAMQATAAAEQAAVAYGFRVQQEMAETKRKQIEADGLKSFKGTDLSQSYLVMKGIEATLELAKSPNAKVIVMGSKDSLPLVLGNVPDVSAK